MTKNLFKCDYCKQMFEAPFPVLNHICKAGSAPIEIATLNEGLPIQPIIENEIILYPINQKPIP